MLDTRQLAAMQAANTKTLDLTCTISRTTETPSNVGATASAPVTVASGVACGLARPSAGLLAALAISKLGVVPQWVVSLPLGTDVRAGDTLTISGGTAGDVLTVQQVVQPQSYATLTLALATEVR